MKGKDLIKLTLSHYKEITCKPSQHHFAMAGRICREFPEQTIVIAVKKLSDKWGHEVKEGDDHLQVVLLGLLNYCKRLVVSSDVVIEDGANLVKDLLDGIPREIA